MSPDMIERIALANGFKLKEQPDGSMALNPYVFEFARALLESSKPEGWVLVPFVPTPKMHAARYAIPMEDKCPQTEWEAMLIAAAPLHHE